MHKCIFFQFQNWVSYGFDFTDRDMDTFMKNMVMFLIVSCMFVAAMTFVMYAPDVRLVDML